MSKFKVGDKVRVLRGGCDSAYWCAYEKGDVHEITRVYSSGDYEVGWQMMDEQDIEPFQPTHTLTVGETYTSENGVEWECIYTTETHAWMKHGGIASPAYAFGIDGSSPWASDGTYRIKFEPVRETVQFALKQEHGGKVNYASLGYEVVDGTPDWTTAKVTPCE